MKLDGLAVSRGRWVAAGFTVLVTMVVVAPLVECDWNSDTSSPDGCGVYSGTPCGAGTLVPPNGVGCYGLICPSGEVCGGTGMPMFPTEAFSCAPGPLACGKEELTRACTTDSDCDGLATCSEEICYGTACPSGQVCSGLSLEATCQPGPDAGAAAAGNEASPEAGAVAAAPEAASVSDAASDAGLTTDAGGDAGDGGGSAEE